MSPAPGNEGTGNESNSIAVSPVLQATQVVAGYTPDLPVIHGLTLHVNSGEIVTIIGPNGAGKSTFIKAVAGLLEVSAGTIQLEQKDIIGVAPHLLAAAGIGYVPQTANVFTSLTIHENLVMGGVALPKNVANQRIQEMYLLYPFLHQRQRQKAGVLSGGQRQILAVARALLTQPKLMLLDEPTAGLAPKAAMELFDVVKGLVSTGVAVLMVEQNARAALRISDRGYVFTQGLNRLDGAAQALLDDPEIGEIFLGLRHDD